MSPSEKIALRFLRDEVRRCQIALNPPRDKHLDDVVDTLQGVWDTLQGFIAAPEPFEGQQRIVTTDPAVNTVRNLHNDHRRIENLELPSEAS